MAADGSAKVIIIAMLANLGIAVAKFIGAFFSQSSALLAEAIHSVVDCTNQILLLVGNKKSKKPPSDSHPLGHGREAFFWSFVVAILLFSLGGMFAIYEGIHKFSEPGELKAPFLGLGILAVSVGLEGFSFAACLKEVRAQNQFGSLWRWFRKTTAAELLVIFTEDAAALLGLIIACAALSMAWWTGDMRWDAAGSILVGCVLVLVAYLLATEIKSLIVGEAPAQDLKPEFLALARKHFTSGEVLRFIAIQTGAHEVMVSAKINPGDLQDLNQAIRLTNRLEAEFKQTHPQVRWQFIELDRHD